MLFGLALPFAAPRTPLGVEVFNELKSPEGDLCACKVRQVQSIKLGLLVNDFR